MEKIKFFGVDRLYKNIKEEILDVTDKVYETGNVLDGEQTRKFETAIRARCNRRYAVAVNSCTQALEFAARYNYVDVPDDSKVAIPAVSFPATYNSVHNAGRSATIIDVDREGLMNINDLDTKRNNIGRIVYVNLYGNVLDYDKLKVAAEFFDSKKFIIEDAAQSFGAFYKGRPSGSLGDISCLSFDPTKNLPNFGSGGMVLTDDHEVWRAVLNWRNNGKENNYLFSGTNSRMSESDCAQMLVKLKYFDEWQDRREDIANYYTEQLGDLVRTPYVGPDVKHAWHKYVIHIPDRYQLKHWLDDHGIETRIHYDRALSQLDSAIDSEWTSVPNALSFVKTCLSLPIYYEMSDLEVDYVVSTIKKFYTLN